MPPRPLRRLPVLTDAVVSCVDYCRLFATMINTDVVAKPFKEVKFGDNRPCIGGEEGAEMFVLHMPRSLFEKQVRLAENHVLHWKMHKGKFQYYSVGEKDRVALSWVLQQDCIGWKPSDVRWKLNHMFDEMERDKSEFRLNKRPELVEQIDYKELVDVYDEPKRCCCNCCCVS